MRTENPQHKARKLAAIRKAAARYRDGQGRERVKISQAKAAMRRAGGRDG